MSHIASARPFPPSLFRQAPRPGRFFSPRAAFSPQNRLFILFIGRDIDIIKNT